MWPFRKRRKKRKTRRRTTVQVPIDEGAEPVIVLYLPKGARGKIAVPPGVKVKRRRRLLGGVKLIITGLDPDDLPDVQVKAPTGTRVRISEEW